MKKAQLILFFFILLLSSKILYSQNNAIQFGSPTKFAQIPDDTVFNLTNQITIEAWIKFTLPNPTCTLSTILSKRFNNTGFSFSIDNGGAMIFEIMSSLMPLNMDSYPETLTTNTWHHVAVTHDGTTAKMYHNGVLVKTRTYSLPITPSTVPLLIGKSHTSTAPFFPGQIDEVRIWNTVISETQINAYYNQTITNTNPNYSNLVAYYKMNQLNTDSNNDGNVDLIANIGPSGELFNTSFVPSCNPLLIEYTTSNINQVNSFQTKNQVKVHTVNQKVLKITVDSYYDTDITRFNLWTNGTTNINDISNAKVWYTGSSSDFDTITQFGTTIQQPPVSNGNMVFSDSIHVSCGRSYFWLTYDIDSTATVNNVVNAVLNEIDLNQTTHSVPLINLIGYGKIKNMCTHKLRIRSTYSGWHRSAVNLYVNGIETLHDIGITFNSGIGPIDFDFEAATDDSISVVLVNQGYGTSNSRFEIIDGNGTVLIGPITPSVIPITSSGYCGWVVNTLNATEIKAYSAILNGSFFNYSPSSFGFAFKKTTDSIWNYIPVLSNPLTHQVNNLEPLTDYEFKTYLIIGVDTVWGDLLQFQTLCTPFTIPFFESFNSTTIPDFWTYNVNNGFGFGTSYGSNVTPVDGSGMFYVNTDLMSNGDVRYISTPEISNLVTGTEIRFWVYRQNGNVNQLGSLKVYANNQNNTTNALLLRTIYRVKELPPVVPTQGWYEYVAVVPADTFTHIIFACTADHVGRSLFDEFSFTPPILCDHPPINSVIIDSITTTSAKIKWMRAGNETSWEVSYKTDPQSGWSILLSNDTSIVLNNLNPGHRYEVKVRSVCSDQSFSLYTFIRSFGTLCAIQSIPYVQDFESTPLGEMPLCFDNYSDGNTQARVSNCSGSNHCMGFYPVSSDDSYYLILPEFNTPINTLRVNVKVLSCHYGVIGVGYFSDFSNLSSFVFLQYVNTLYGVDPWMTVDYNNLTSITGNERLAIIVRGISASLSSLNIDSVMVMQQPSCLPPLGLSVSTIQANSATFNWTPSPVGLPMRYDLEYRDTSNGNWTLIPDVTPPYTCNFLMPLTTYQFRVKAVCDTLVPTDFSVPIEFTTKCPLINLSDFNQTFDQLLPNSCWEIKSGQLPASASVSLINISETWMLSSVFQQNTGVIHLNNYAHEWYITPPIQLGDGSNLYQLEFDMAATNPYSTNPGDLHLSPSIRFVVLISRDFGDTWSSAGIIKEWNNSTGTPFSQLNNFLQTQTIPLYDSVSMAPYSGAIKIAFYVSKYDYGSEFYYNDIHIDNISINPISNCIKPTNITITDLSPNSIELNWTSTSANSSWIVAYGPENFSMSNGTIVTSNQNSCIINSLVDGMTYDFYIKSICGSGDSSAWSLKKTHATLCNPLVLPYSQSFNSLVNPDCWSQSITGDLYENSWRLVSSTNAGGTTNELQFIPDTGSGISRLISPPFDFSGQNDPFISFKIKLVDNQFIENCVFKIQTSSDLVNWVDQPFSIIPGSGSFGPLTSTVHLNGLSGMNYISWVFEGTHNSIETVYMDDIFVTSNSIVCPSPSGLAASNITSQSAMLSWIPQGDENSWIVSFKSDTGSSWITHTVNNVPEMLLTSLLPSTNYLVKVKSICNGIESTYSDILFFTTNVSSIHDFELNQWIEIFPNPTSNQIVISVMQNDIFLKRYMIFDIYGKILQNSCIDSNIKSIDMSTFSKGVYHLRIETNHGIIYKKIVKI